MIEPIPVDVRPDLLAWLTAGGTVLATLLAGFAILMQVMDRRQRSAEQRRAQASRISAWIEVVALHRNQAGVPVIWTNEVKIRNGSEEIVYDVWLHPIEKDRVQVVDVGIVAPHSVVSFPVDESVATPGRIPFELEFVDATGQPWTRHPDGRLTERKRAKSGHLASGQGSDGAPEVPPKGPEQPSTTPCH